MADPEYTAVGKRCTACKQCLPRTEFHRNKSKADGLATECKPCVIAKVKARYEADPEKHRQAMRDNYRNKAEEYKARSRRWELENAERKRELRAAYREKYREQIKIFSQRDWQRHNEKRLARKKEYRAENPELGVAQCRKYQAKKQMALPRWANLEKIKGFYFESRRLTAETGIPHHVDHIYPLNGETVSGLHNEFNLRVVTAFENQSKGNRLIHVE